MSRGESSDMTTGANAPKGHGPAAKSSPFDVYGSIRGERRRIWLLSAIAIVGAQVEALALVLVVPLAQTLAQGDDHFVGSLGPIDVDLPRSALAGLTVGLLVLALIITAGELWLKAQTMAR